MPLADRVELRLCDRFGDPLGTGTDEYQEYYTAEYPTGGAPVTLPAVGVSFSVGLGGSGFLSCEVDSRAEPVASDPDILDDCVIKVAVPLADGEAPTEILAYANRARSGVLWEGSGVQTRSIESAPTLWTAWAQDAILHPESNIITQMAGENRHFGWMSSIYDYASDPDYTWSTPSSGTAQNATAGVRAGNPPDWPSALGAARWITRGATSNGMRHLFVADCVVPVSSFLTVYFSADESCSVYFGGELIIQTSSSETGYQSMDEWSAWVPAGTYRVGIDKTSIVSRGGDGVDPVLLAVATNTNTGAVDTVLLTTNNSDFSIFTLDPVTGVVPSLTAAQIALELHGQATSRGVDTWAAITPDFDANDDSDAQPWVVREERAWRVGYDTYFDMLEGLGDLGFCPDITPDLTFKAWADRGVDRSATVTIEALVGADSVIEQGVGVAATYLPVETQDGWVVLSNPTAQAVYGRREAALSLGNAPSVTQGKQLGLRVLDERLSRPTSEWSVEFYALDGCVPFADFDLGDTVTVKIGAVETPRVVLEIGATAEHVGALVRWTIKTGDVL